MKLSLSVRLTAVLLVLMLVLAGCAGQKLTGQDPRNTGDPAGSLTMQDPSDSSDDDGSDESNVSNDAGNDSSGNTSGKESTDPDTEGGEEGNGTGTDGSGDAADTTDTEDKNENHPVKVKALYLTGWTVGSSKKVEHYVELANTTEINAYVVDIKDDDGYVGYESQIPEVRENGTWKKKYNPESVLKAFHDNGIYVIGRLVVYKDPVYSMKRPDLAIKDINGGLWKDRNKMTWLNPYNKENWDYTISIAKEAVALGFDEIQFDYVRFPSDGKPKNMDFTGIEQERYEAICEFLAYAKEKIPEVPISADVFGIILESPKDTEKIGQYLEFVGKDIDYISPMVYPSHYALGQIVNKVKFDVPDLDPYGVVYNSLIKCRDRIAQTDGYKAGVRPYLQDFTATWLVSKDKKTKYYQVYGAEQVRQQIKAVYDAGYEEWILWDASNKYSEDALLKEN